MHAVVLRHWKHPPRGDPSQSDVTDRSAASRSEHRMRTTLRFEIGVDVAVLVMTTGCVHGIDEATAVETTGQSMPPTGSIRGR